MISFLSDEVRLRFHSLPVDQQQEWEAMAQAMKHLGRHVVVLFVDDELSEVSVRIDDQVDTVV